METPKKERKIITEKSMPMMFTGGAQGANVQIHLTLAVKDFGMYWFDVMWGDEMLTRIPLDIKPFIWMRRCYG